jgi:hypothetical protein
MKFFSTSKIERFMTPPNICISFSFADLMLSQTISGYKPNFAKQLTALLGFPWSVGLCLRVTDLFSIVVLLTLFPACTFSLENR